MNLDILQIGSHTGLSCNNINVLELLNKHSNAIFVEPVKILFDELVKNFNQSYPNNKFIFINKACSHTIGKIVLYVPDVPVYNIHNESEYINRGLLSWSDQLSSVLPNHVQDHNLNMKVNPITVDCTTIDNIIDTYSISEIKYLHIDTEGHDFEVMQGLNLDTIKPLKIRFEHKHMEGSNTPIGKKYNSLLAKLYSYNYKIEYQDTEDTLVTLNNK